MDALNLNSLTVGDDGRVSFSGLNSGIDFRAAVDSIIAARRIPVDQIEEGIAENKDKIAAIEDLRTRLNALESSLQSLHGAVSLGNANDIFEAKSAFASTTRDDGQSPAAASDLIGVTVSNSAEVGSHSLEVLRTAKAHKVSSDAFASTTADLGFSGDFTVNGQSITVSATDSLTDVRDRINAANAGDNASGVSATIVSAGTSEHFLVLTADETGTAMTLSDTTNTPLQSLGVLDGGAAIKNELQAAQTARLTADGLKDLDRFESGLIQSATVALDQVAGSASFPGSFDITGGTGTRTINYAAGDTLEDLRDAINAETANTGVTASIMQEANGVRLVLTEGSGATVTLNDTSGLLADLNVDNDLIIERSSNTIDDLFSGVTLSLFQAQEGTEIKIDVDRNLGEVKSQIQSFVDAFNELRRFINEQTLVDPTTGQVTEETGPLFGNRLLSTVSNAITSVIGAGAEGVSPEFSVLAQIGIDFVDNNSLDDELDEDTLVIDETKLDEALLNNPSDVRKLFGFDFSSSDSRVSLLGFTGNTTFNASGYTLNIGGVGSAEELSAAIGNQAATLDQADSFGATTSGQFEINGTAIAYDVTADTLETLQTKITNALIPGVSAQIVDDGGQKRLEIKSNDNALTINNDTGDLLANMAFTTQDHLVGSANIDGDASGVGDGTANAKGKQITVTDQSGAEGLKLQYSGTSDVSGVQLDFTVGIGAELFFAVRDLLDPTTGAVENEITSFKDTNEFNQDRADRMIERLDFQRERLIERFVSMEAALSQLESLRDQVDQLTSSLNGNDN